MADAGSTVNILSVLSDKALRGRELVKHVRWAPKACSALIKELDVLRAKLDELKILAHNISDSSTLAQIHAPAEECSHALDAVQAMFKGSSLGLRRRVTWKVKHEVKVVEMRVRIRICKDMFIALLQLDHIQKLGSGEGRVQDHAVLKKAIKPGLNSDDDSGIFSLSDLSRNGSRFRRRVQSATFASHDARSEYDDDHLADSSFSSDTSAMTDPDTTRHSTISFQGIYFDDERPRMRTISAASAPPDFTWQDAASDHSKELDIVTEDVEEEQVPVPGEDILEHLETPTEANHPLESSFASHDSAFSTPDTTYSSGFSFDDAASMTSSRTSISSTTECAPGPVDLDLSASPEELDAADEVSESEDDKGHPLEEDVLNTHAPLNQIETALPLESQDDEMVETTPSNSEFPAPVLDVFTPWRGTASEGLTAIPEEVEEPIIVSEEPVIVLEEVEDSIIQEEPIIVHEELAVSAEEPTADEQATPPAEESTTPTDIVVDGQATELEESVVLVEMPVTSHEEAVVLPGDSSVLSSEESVIISPEEPAVISPETTVLSPEESVLTHEDPIEPVNSVTDDQDSITFTLDPQTTQVDSTATVEPATGAITEVLDVDGESGDMSTSEPDVKLPVAVEPMLPVPSEEIAVIETPASPAEEIVAAPEPESESESQETSSPVPSDTSAESPSSSETTPSTTPEPTIAVPATTGDKPIVSSEPSTDNKVDTTISIFTPPLRRISLHAAVMSNSLSTVRTQLETFGDDLNSRWHGKTPLQLALELQSKDIAAYLFSRGAMLSLHDLQYSTSKDFTWAHEENWYRPIRAVLDHAPPRRALTKEDVISVAGILKGRLRMPIHVVRQVLDMAEYWVASSVSREDRERITHFTPEKAYLSSEPIVGRVRRVVFKTTSADQGWAGTKLFDSLYDGSHTWFEAGLQSSSSTRRVEVQRNVRASSHYRTHTSVWSSVSGDREVVEWLDAISPGDRIALYPKAAYRGWGNNVKRAEVVIYTACF